MCTQAFTRRSRGAATQKSWPAVRPSTELEFVPADEFATRVDAVIGRHAPEHAPTAARYFSLGDAGRLRSLFTAAGFREVETFTDARRFPFASFEAYFAPIKGKRAR